MCNEFFKDRLKHALDMRSMSASELSRRCGIHKSVISRYLHGEIEPKPSAVKNIADALGVAPTWMLGFDGELRTVEIPPIVKKDHNPIDYNKLSGPNRMRIKAYYQALLDSQEEES